MRRRAGCIIALTWNTLGLGLAIVTAFHIGQWAGYGKGARDLARLVIEMRQGGYETPDAWDRGDI